MKLPDGCLLVLAPRAVDLGCAGLPHYVSEGKKRATMRYLTGVVASGNNLGQQLGALQVAHRHGETLEGQQSVSAKRGRSVRALTGRAIHMTRGCRGWLMTRGKRGLPNQR